MSVNFWVGVRPYESVYDGPVSTSRDADVDTGGPGTPETDLTRSSEGRRSEGQGLSLRSERGLWQSTSEVERGRGRGVQAGHKE